jgi:transposase-like protein
MGEYELLALLGQAEIGDAGNALRTFLRGAARELVCRVIAAEVEMMCGVTYRPDNSSGCYRSGSAPGSVLYEGRHEKLKRPRVRKDKKGGGSEEVPLLTYAAAREPGELHAILVRSLCGGVSTRDQKSVHPESPSASKSSVSRLWAREGARMLEEFRLRNIMRDDWLVLMLDGVRLANELWAIVALGVAMDGTKHLLDFELGASESAEVTTSLVSRLAERGFSPKEGCRLLCVFDGSKALRKGAKKFWPDAVFQRCLVHKERNLRRYLSKKDWGELSRLMNRLRKVQGPDAGREALMELRRYVGKRNADALASLDEAGDELIALHLLEVPNTLHKNLLSTNIIENSILNIRRKTSRVSRWRPETNQTQRWLAMALTEAEKGFRKLSGYQDLPKLAEVLVRSVKVAEAA